MEERYYRLREAMSKGTVPSESVACLAHDRWLPEMVCRAGEACVVGCDVEEIVQYHCVKGPVCQTKTEYLFLTFSIFFFFLLFHE